MRYIDLKKVRQKDIQQFYLLTTTADGFFRKLGWTVTVRKEAPLEIGQSKEFISICPSTATHMKYTLSSGKKNKNHNY